LAMGRSPPGGRPSCQPKNKKQKIKKHFFVIEGIWELHRGCLTLHDNIEQRQWLMALSASPFPPPPPTHSGLMGRRKGACSARDSARNRRGQSPTLSWPKTGRKDFAEPRTASNATSWFSHERPWSFSRSPREQIRTVKI
jgi:hypothetical protein